MKKCWECKRNRDGYCSNKKKPIRWWWIVRMCAAYRFDPNARCERSKQKAREARDKVRQKLEW